MLLILSSNLNILGRPTSRKVNHQDIHKASILNHSISNKGPAIRRGRLLQRTTHRLDIKTSQINNTSTTMPEALSTISVQTPPDPENHNHTIPPIQT